MAREKRDVANFSKIELLAAGEIHLQQADEYSLEIEAENEILERLTSRVKEGSLLLDIEKSESISTDEPIRYFVTMPKIEVVRISAGGKLLAESIKGTSFLLDVPGAANVQLESVEVNAFRLDVKGAVKMNLNELTAQGISLDVKGTLKLIAPSVSAEAITSNIEGTLNLEIGGEARAQIIHSPGVINYQAAALQSSQLTLNAQGMANLTVWVNDNLNVRLQGVGNLRYYGNPERSIKIQGIGNVQRLGDKPKELSHV